MRNFISHKDISRKHVNTLYVVFLFWSRVLTRVLRCRSPTLGLFDHVKPRGLPSFHQTANCAGVTVDDGERGKRHGDNWVGILVLGVLGVVPCSALVVRRCHGAWPTFHKTVVIFFCQARFSFFVLLEAVSFQSWGWNWYYFKNLLKLHPTCYSVVFQPI